MPGRYHFALIAVGKHSRARAGTAGESFRRRARRSSAAATSRSSASAASPGSTATASPPPPPGLRRPCHLHLLRQLAVVRSAPYKCLKPVQPAINADEQQFVNLVNQARQSLGRLPLAINSKLEPCGR